MKTISLTLLLALICILGFAQNVSPLQADSLNHELSIAKNDTSRVLILVSLCEFYRQSNPDSALLYGQKAFKIAEQINFPKGLVRAYSEVGRIQVDLGNLPKALKMYFKAKQIAENNHIEAESAKPINFIGGVYLNLEDYPRALNYFQQAKKIYELSKDNASIAHSDMNIGNAFVPMNQLDSALFYYQKAYNEMIQTSNGVNPLIFLGIGNLQVKLGNNRLALDYYQKGLKITLKNNIHRASTSLFNAIADLYKKTNQLDSCTYYAKKGLKEAQLISFQRNILAASTLLAELYEPRDAKEALRYYKIATAAKDSLFGKENMQMIAQEQERQEEIKNAEITYQNQFRQYALLAGLAILLLVAFFLYRNNQEEKKAKNLIQEQKDKVETTLSQLKSTQAQLIQSEKLASLGELTAGIAHEIQNPLNFVNNFSEVSAELVEEMNQELDNGDINEAKEIANDLKQNLEKINFHGKRASSIVKGMLEHSRQTSGERELTDINILADEYLRLSYHGIRSKDSSFNSDYETDFDETLPKIEVISQDMGRVLLNLINNAFWAVKTVTKPLVTVKTEQYDNQIIIKVIDNGQGMSEEVKAKIFQPFFTTKPTGQGTGLGLSLAYDIVTKGHGGTIDVESVEGDGTTFIVKLQIV